ncbi:MAG TPA: hypothetical protein VH255_08870, partial [Verrucomicrobiae bacterium]|nr:hypothetical protein [Verrucomicrobiae bacterium]
PPIRQTCSVFQVGMEELFSQPGIKPCTAGIPIDQNPNCDGWLEDDGSCEENQPCSPDDGIALGNLFYPNAAIVEARINLPAGAPALPPGFFIGYLTLDQLNQPPRPPGNILTPPGPGVNNQGGPWVAWKTKVDCVNAGGRFAFIYIDEVIS